MFLKEQNIEYKRGCKKQIIENENINIMRIVCLYTTNVRNKREFLNNNI